MGRLVLSRRHGERVRIDVGTETIWIGVVDSTPHRARLSFEASLAVQIVRDDAIDKTPCTAKCVGPNRQKH